MATACVHVAELGAAEHHRHVLPDRSHIRNIGTSSDCTIRELAETVARVTAYPGRLVFDASQPDRAPRKLMDASLARALGWRPIVGLEDGLRDICRWFVNHRAEARE